MVGRLEKSKQMYLGGTSWWKVLQRDSPRRHALWPSAFIFFLPRMWSHGWIYCPHIGAKRWPWRWMLRGWIYKQTTARSYTEKNSDPQTIGTNPFILPPACYKSDRQWLRLISLVTHYSHVSQNEAAQLLLPWWLEAGFVIKELGANWGLGVSPPRETVRWYIILLMMTAFQRVTTGPLRSCRDWQEAYLMSDPQLPICRLLQDLFVFACTGS